MKKNAVLFLYSLFVAALTLPIMILCFFSFPTVDDYSIAESISRLGYFGAQMDSYMHWSGRFVPGVFCFLHPLLFHSLLFYRIIALFFVLGTFLALHIFVQRILAPGLKIQEQTAISLSIFVLYLYGAPSIVESFYWLPATLCYQLASIALLLLLSAAAVPAKSRPRRRTIVFCCICALVLAGSNESSGFSFLILSILYFLFQWRFARAPGFPAGAAVLSAAAGFAIVYFAPGNHVRAAELHFDPHVLQGLVLSARFLAASVMTWGGNLMFFMATLIAISLAMNLRRPAGFQMKNAFPHPAVPMAIYGIALLAVFAPAAFVTGRMPPPRALNYAYIFFLAGWFLNVRFAVVWHLSRTGAAAAPLPRYALGFLFVLAVAALVQHNNIRTAFGDIVKGKAAAYSRQLSERDKSIRESGRDTVILDTIVTRPRSLYFGDITADPGSWQNRPYAYYYGKKAIRLKCPYKGEYVFY